MIAVFRVSDSSNSFIPRKIFSKLIMLVQLQMSGQYVRVIQGLVLFGRVSDPDRSGFFANQDPGFKSPDPSINKLLVSHDGLELDKVLEEPDQKGQC